MPTFVFYSLIAATCFSLSGIIEKLASKYAITSRWPLLFWYYMTFIPFVFLVPMFAPIVVPATLSEWLAILGYSLFFLLGNICFFTAIFSLDASVFSPFFQLQAAFLAILAYVFLGERFPLGNYLWIALALTGAVLITIDEHMSLRSFLQRAIFLIIAMQLFHAISNMFAGFILRFTDFWNLMWWPALVSMIFIILFTTFVNGLKVKVRWKQLRPLLLTNAITFVGGLSLFRAFQENVTISGVLSLMSGPITFFIAIVFSRIKPKLLEHHSPTVYTVRALGIILLLFGAAKLSGL